MEPNPEIVDLDFLMSCRDAIRDNNELINSLKKQLAEINSRGDLVLGIGTDERRMVEQAMEDRKNFDHAIRNQLSREYKVHAEDCSHGLSERIKSIQDRYPDYEKQLADLNQYYKQLDQPGITPLKDTIEAIRGKPEPDQPNESNESPGSAEHHLRPVSPGRTRFETSGNPDESGNVVGTREIYSQAVKKYKERNLQQGTQEKTQDRTP